MIGAWFGIDSAQWIGIGILGVNVVIVLAEVVKAWRSTRRGEEK